MEGDVQAIITDLSSVCTKPGVTKGYLAHLKRTKKNCTGLENCWWRLPSIWSHRETYHQRLELQAIAIVDVNTIDVPGNPILGYYWVISQYWEISMKTALEQEKLTSGRGICNYHIGIFFQQNSMENSPQWKRAHSESTNYMSINVLQRGDPTKGRI